MLFGQDKAWYNVVKQSMKAIDTEKEEISQYKAQGQNVAGAVRYALGACRVIPSHTYADSALVIMDWALLKVNKDRLGSNKLLKEVKDVLNTLHSEDPYPNP